jgi:hypothetical protein
MVRDMTEASLRKEVRLHMDKTIKLGGASRISGDAEAQTTERDHVGSRNAYSRRRRCGIRR